MQRRLTEAGRDESAEVGSGPESDDDSGYEQPRRGPAASPVDPRRGDRGGNNRKDEADQLRLVLRHAQAGGKVAVEIRRRFCGLSAARSQNQQSVQAREVENIAPAQESTRDASLRQRPCDAAKRKPTPRRAN